MVKIEKHKAGNYWREEEKLHIGVIYKPGFEDYI